MEEQDILNLWKSQNVKLDQSLAVNLELLKEMKAQKARSVLSSLKRKKAWGIVGALIYLFIIGFMLFVAIRVYSPSVNYFIVSMGIIFLINVLAISDYVKHIVLANEVDYEGSVMEIQQKLSRLQISIINYVRMMFLQIPFWSTFYLSSAWFPSKAPWLYIVIQIMATGGCVYLSYWLFKNLRLENAHKKWFKVLTDGSGNEAVTKAIEFFNEIEEFKKENAVV